jgi:secreted PhoX family phosphatase
MANRRQFLQGFGALAGTAVTAAPLRALMAKTEAGSAGWSLDSGYGSLRPTLDQTTGLPLIELPEGFSYHTYGWTDDPMDDGLPTPARHDGMAVVKAQGDLLTLVRNHEIVNDRGAFGPPEITYDPAGAGGTSNLQFDLAKGQFVRSWASLSGTMQNCAGGPTPWGSWLSCEELLINPGFVMQDGGKRRELRLRNRHGYVFEVPADKLVKPEPLLALGQIQHEAIAIDPKTDIVYETEDNNWASGFYRMIPAEPGNLKAGGRLQMMKVNGREDSRTGVPINQAMDVSWVDIEHPERGHTPGTQDMSGVIKQGIRQGATIFARLEGCWYANDLVFFTSTSGGDLGKGQVYSFDPRNQVLHLIYESRDQELMDKPDNITISPSGSVVICEDGSRKGMMLLMLSKAGDLFPLARNTIQLASEKNDFKGDYSTSEWCGASFSPDGKWLFVNIQKPGITFAITGPWQHQERRSI